MRPQQRRSARRTDSPICANGPHMDVRDVKRMASIALAALPVHLCLCVFVHCTVLRRYGWTVTRWGLGKSSRAERQSHADHRSANEHITMMEVIINSPSAKYDANWIMIE